MRRIYLSILVAFLSNISMAQVANVEEQQIVYHQEESKSWDLIHTQLAVKFDWEKRQMNGQATIWLKPYFYSQSQLSLDAKGMEIISVETNGAHENFEYDGHQLLIELNQDFDQDDTLQVSIDYVAKPYDREIQTGTAIANDRGLYFIKPDASDPNKPFEIWTHGETEAASVWCPTIDAPNEKATHQISMTVDRKFVTLSNGLKISTQEHPNGTRTDTWDMDQPHAPYLMMMAVGEFETSTDQWEDVQLSYHMEADYGQFAKDVFKNTPEMMAFFSEILDYPFPWKKYDQVVVRDFVSGAMENTTASIFMEELNVSDRELKDDNWDYIIAHELFHQWFGDLVTCESWANLTLNEGFASYSEYLWNEHKYGKDEADYQFLLEKEEYLAEAKESPKPLIRYYYQEVNEMYDSHTYNKGALVLHMLRNYLGDRAFFKGLNVYLTNHAFQTVELAHLRMAFEEVSGQDLHWFFDQWYFFEGHPEIEITHEYKKGLLTVVVNQAQTARDWPVYELPVFIDIYKGSEFFSHPVVLKEAVEVFEFPMDSKPDLVIFDSEHQLLAEVTHEKSEEELLFQMLHEKSLVSRVETLDSLHSFKKKGAIDQVLKASLSDPHFIVRQYGLEYLIDEGMAIDQYEDQINELLIDSNAKVRSYALSYVSENAFEQYKTTIEAALGDESYLVLGTAISLWTKNGQLLDAAQLESFKKESNINVVLALAVYFNAHRDLKSGEWFGNNLKTLRKGDLFYFMQVYAERLMLVSEKERKAAVPKLKLIAQTNTYYLARFAALQVLMLNADLPNVNAIVEETKAMETDKRLIKYYQDF